MNTATKLTPISGINFNNHKQFTNGQSKMESTSSKYLYSLEVGPINLRLVQLD